MLYCGLECDVSILYTSKHFKSELDSKTADLFGVINLVLPLAEFRNIYFFLMFSLLCSQVIHSLPWDSVLIFPVKFSLSWLILSGILFLPVCSYFLLIFFHLGNTRSTFYLTELDDGLNTLLLERLKKYTTRQLIAS